MKDKKVLACVDQSRFADGVGDYAAWAASRIQAPLEFLHVIDRHPEIGTGEDHSGAIGLGAHERLLTQLVEKDAVLTKAAREQGRIFLHRLSERAMAAGVESVDVRQRHGALEATLVEQEPSVRLFVLGRRGQSAETTQRDLGRNVERVIRSLHKPILTVTETFREPRNALIAFDGGIVTRRGVELIAGSPLLRGLPVHLLMSGAKSPNASKQLEWAQNLLESSGFDSPASLIPGDAESIIAKTVKALEIDLLIMGAYSHSSFRRLLFGSKTSDLLRSSMIPTLIIR
jgi:nucleotide-binding universal stress UspA family protein